MHEFSLAQNILEIVEDTASKNQVTHVTEIVLEIGTLSGVELPALDMALESLRNDSIIEMAIITKDIVQAEAICKNCKFQFEPADYFSACPRCGNFGPEIVRGKELRVKSIVAE